MHTRIITGLVAALLGCNGSGELFAPPSSLLSDEIGGLKATLSVAPGNVVQHNPFEVRVRVTNPTADTIRIGTSSSCLFLPHVLRNGERVPFEGTALFCLAAVSTHVFPPAFEETVTFQLRAEFYAEEIGDVDGAAAPRGEYSVQVRFEYPGHPILARTLRIF